LPSRIVIGLVPADRAFFGFSDDIVIIVGAALVLSAAIHHREEQHPADRIGTCRPGLVREGIRGRIRVSTAPESAS
jgi:hypothetical protein